MKRFAAEGRYKSFQMLRHDTELMAHNALAFNSSGDRYVFSIIFVANTLASRRF
jgi:hypothetical protein